MSLIFACCLLYNYFVKYRYFKILESSASQLIAGARHAHNLFQCRIKLVAKRPAGKLIFDELWIEDRLYKIRITNEANQPVENQFQRKQILFIDIDKEIQKPVDSLPPEKQGTKIFLGYQVANKRKYFPITDYSEETPERFVA